MFYFSAQHTPDRLLKNLMYADKICYFFSDRLMSAIFDMYLNVNK